MVRTRLVIKTMCNNNIANVYITQFTPPPPGPMVAAEVAQGSSGSSPPALGLMAAVAQGGSGGPPRSPGGRSRGAPLQRPPPGVRTLGDAATASGPPKLGPNAAMPPWAMASLGHRHAPQSVQLSIYLNVFIYPSVHLFIHPSDSDSTHPSIHPSLSLYIYIQFYIYIIYIYPFISLSYTQ